MVILDTNILVYAVGARHPLCEHSRRVVAAIESGRLDAQTTAFVIQEFLHVASRARGRPAAVQLAATYTAMLAPLLVTEERHVVDALALYERHDRLGAFDSFLAATAIAVGATLVSADRAFASIPGLRHVDPATAALDELLR